MEDRKSTISAMSTTTILSQVAAPLSILAHTLIGAYCISQTPRGSPLRPVGIALAVLLGYVAYNTCKSFSSSDYYNAYFPAFSFLASIQLINLLIFMRLDSSDLVKLKDQYFSKDNSNFITAWALTINERGIRTPWLTKNCPPWPTYYKLPAKDPSTKTTRIPAPPRGQFLLRQMIVLIWQMLMYDLIVNIPSPPPEESFPPGAEFRYLTATKEEWITRISTSVVTWVFVARLMVDIFYRPFSIVVVGLGIGSPEDFPPMFGRMKHAYTLRNFWGKFWHQILRWHLTGLSTFITKDVLRLPKPSFLERYTNISLVFFLSGLLHYIHDGAQSKGPQIGTLMFFESFALGIMIEDGVQEVWRKLSQSKDGKNAKKPKRGEKKEDNDVPLWQKLVGYIWVAGFISMVTPWFVYSNGREPKELFWALPFSFVGTIGLPMTAGLVAVGSIPLLTVFGGEV